MPFNPEFADNPDPRCACLLLLDTSGSMSGEPIAALNDGLTAFQRELQDDPIASRRVECAIVTFGQGGVQVVQEFIPVESFEPPVLASGGGTPMAEAILAAFDLLSQRKTEYRENGIAYYRPWIFLITDGEPTDSDRIPVAVERVQSEEANRGVAFFAIGVGENVNYKTLAQFTDRVRKLSGLRFQELFRWLSASQRRISTSGVGDQIPLPPADAFTSPV